MLCELLKCKSPHFFFGHPIYSLKVLFVVYFISFNSTVLLILFILWIIPTKSYSNVLQKVQQILEECILTKCTREVEKVFNYSAPTYICIIYEGIIQCAINVFQWLTLKYPCGVDWSLNLNKLSMQFTSLYSTYIHFRNNITTEIKPQ